MTANRRIAAGIDQRVRQLAGQNLSDSALVDQMVAYMADLQALWNSTTDEELDALCEEYPGFVRYATVMENLSEALRTGVGVPEHVTQQPRLLEHIKGPMQRLLAEGAAIERRLQQWIDESRAGREVDHEMSDVDVLLREWSPAVSRFVREVQESGLAAQAQQPILRAFKEMAASIGQLHEAATSAQALARRHTVQTFRPRMTINRRFMALADIRATLVRTSTGSAGRRPTVMLAPELTIEQRRAVKVFDLERWFPTILSCMNLEAVEP